MRCVKCGTYVYEDYCPNCQTPITESIEYEGNKNDRGIKMILVIYKDKKEQTIQIPYQTVQQAKKKADELKKRYTNVKVVKVEEEIIYIP